MDQSSDTSKLHLGQTTVAYFSGPNICCYIPISVLRNELWRKEERRSAETEGKFRKEQPERAQCSTNS